LNRRSSKKAKKTPNEPQSVQADTAKHASTSYLDAEKFQNIKNWVQNVNRIQATEGKWTETINKIIFYD
jgi:hypothetical protein